jgi:hypothetical protein
MVTDDALRPPKGVVVFMSRLAPTFLVFFLPSSFAALAYAPLS